MDAEKKVLVRIRARETVRYDQTREMTEREIIAIRRALAKPRYRDEGEEIVADWIDRRDITDADDFEIDDLEVVDDDDKVVRNLLDGIDDDRSLLAEEDD